jgi:hypothetical protein
VTGVEHKRVELFKKTISIGKKIVQPRKKGIRNRELQHN